MTVRTFSINIYWRQYKLAPAAHPNLLFWFGFISLNLLLFLPTYILNRETSTLLPLSHMLEQDFATTFKQLVIWRNNLDIFRLNLEFTLLIAAWVYVPVVRNGRIRSIFLGVMVFVYFLTLVYTFYESLSIYFYQVDAVIYAHFQLLIGGLGFLVEHMQLKPALIISVIIAIVVCGIFLLFLIRAFTEEKIVDNLNFWSKLFLAMFLIFVVAAIFQNQRLLASPKSVVSSLIAKLQKNGSDSFSLAERVRALSEIQYDQAYNYEGHDLLSKPNIYLIFIESYGSVLYKRDSFRGTYENILDEKQSELRDNGWLVTSALSESPTWGGGSWMAYTSLLFGLRVDNHPQYLSLLDKFQDQDYPDMGSR